LLCLDQKIFYLYSDENLNTYDHFLGSIRSLLKFYTLLTMQQFFVYVLAVNEFFVLFVV